MHVTPFTSLQQTRLVDTKLFRPVGPHSRGANGGERLQCVCFSESRADGSEQNLELGECDRTNLAHNLASKGRLQSGVNVMHSSQKQDNCFSNNKRCTCVGFLEAMTSANDTRLTPPHISVRGGKPRLWTEAEKVLGVWEKDFRSPAPCLASHGRRHETCPDRST